MRWWFAAVLLVAACGGATDDKGAAGDSAAGDDDDDTTTRTTPAPGDDDDDAPSATAVDVLFVVDDSASMAGAQDLVRQQVSALTEEVALRGVDAVYAVVTTTSGDLVGGDALGPGRVDALVDRLAVGVKGSDQEQGLATALAAATSGTWRRGVPLRVVGVTDEEDCSHDGALDGASQDDCYLRPEALTPVADLLADLRATAPDVAVFVFNGDEDESGCASFPSGRWAEAAGATGGVVYPLCSGHLASMRDLAQRL